MANISRIIPNPLLILLLLANTGKPLTISAKDIRKHPINTPIPNTARHIMTVPNSIFTRKIKRILPIIAPAIINDSYSLTFFAVCDNCAHLGTIDNVEKTAKYPPAVITPAKRAKIIHNTIIAIFTIYKW